jgi:uncharacterized protein (TIGR02996 family)
LNSHEAFMQTIRENPDDNAPRLVYADWLEENGYELYAEFIRVQIELARTGQQDKRYLLRAVTPQDIAARDALEPRVIALMQREQELKKKHAAWRRLPPNWPALSDGYERGLLYFWRGPADQFLRYGEEIWEYGPVRRLHIEGKDVEIERFANNPLLVRIQELDVTPNNRLDRAGIALAHSKFLQTGVVVRLWRYGKRISPDAEREMIARFGSMTPY